jgi:uncharacterized membrane protein YbaN (DUF454 family)
VLAILGIVLPLLPTTPFLLVSAFAFAKSSKRWHTWLIEHKTLGVFITNWQKHGAIDKSAKWLSILSMIIVFGFSYALKAPLFILATQAAVLGTCAMFVLSRPSPPKEQIH